jgi:hypothetical protein
MSIVSSGLSSLWKAITHPNLATLFPKTAQEATSGLSILSALEGAIAAVPDGNVKTVATKALVSLSSDLQTVATVSAFGEAATAPGIGSAVEGLLGALVSATPAAAPVVPTPAPLVIPALAPIPSIPQAPLGTAEGSVLNAPSIT